jgi:transcription elongation factor Elf1
MARRWIRTCQECGHEQAASQPQASKITDSYAFSKCRKCGSEALDYGRWYDPDAKEDYTENEQ